MTSNRHSAAAVRGNTDVQSPLLLLLIKVESTESVPGLVELGDLSIMEGPPLRAVLTIIGCEYGTMTSHTHQDVNPLALL